MGRAVAEDRTSGPVGPQGEGMTEHDELLGAYVDGELDAAAAREAERLIGADARAGRIVDRYRETTALLRAACGEQFYASGPAPAGFATARRRRPTRRQIGLAVAASAAAAVAGYGIGSLWPTSDRSDLLDEIAEYQGVFGRETTHLAEIPASRVDELTDWLGRRLDRKLLVPDLAEAGLQFAGGRMLVIGGEPVAQFEYTRAQGAPVAVCIARLAGGPSGLRLDRRDGFRLASWQDGSFAYVIIGD